MTTGYYWLWFYADSIDDLQHNVVRHTEYAEFACCPTNFIMPCYWSHKLLVQGMIKTNVTHMEENAELYAAIERVSGEYHRKIQKFDPETDFGRLLDRKRLYIHYACAMIPDSFMVSSLEGGILMATTLDDVFGAIRQYWECNNQALTEEAFNYAQSTPAPIFYDWLRYVCILRDLEFE